MADPEVAMVPPCSRSPLLWAVAILLLIALGQLIVLSIAFGPRLKTAAQAAAAAFSGTDIHLKDQTVFINPPPVAIPPPETIGTEIHPATARSVPADDINAEPDPNSSAHLNVAREASPQEFILRTSLESVLIARSARKQGDMQLALDKLREAQALAPDNPEVVAELAITFEQMGLIDKAIAHWRTVYQLGPRGGIYYRMATEKITHGVGQQTNSASDLLETEQRGGLLQTRESSKLLIESAEVQKLNADEERQGSLELRLIFRAQERPLSIRETKVQVYFYDIINDEKVELTNADTTSKWTTKPIDWVNGVPEELRVTYTPPAEDTEDANSRRKFLGYIVSVYYKNKLQDVVAEPKRLLDLFPPPNTLSDELPEIDPTSG